MSSRVSLLFNGFRLKGNVLLRFRIPDEVNENPCFPTRNDRMAFINDSIVQERCVSVEAYRPSDASLLPLENSGRLSEQSAETPEVPHASRHGTIDRRVALSLSVHGLLSACF